MVAGGRSGASARGGRHPVNTGLHDPRTRRTAAARLRRARLGGGGGLSDAASTRLAGYLLPAAGRAGAHAPWDGPSELQPRGDTRDAGPAYAPGAAGKSGEPR